MFMGYISEIIKMLNHKASELKDNDDDQLFYTKIFLNEDLRVCNNFKKII